MEQSARTFSPIRGVGEVADARRLLEITARIGRVCGFEFDVASGRLAWLRQTYNVFDDDQAAQPSLTRLADFLSPTDHARALAQLSKTVETGEPTEDEFDAVTAKGAAIRIHVIREAEWENGRIVKVYGAIRDITQEASTSRKLRIANEGMKNAIDIADVRLWETDAELDRFHFISDAVAPGDVVPTYRPISIAVYASELMEPDGAARMKATFERVLETGEPATQRLRVARPALGVRWIEQRLRRRIDDNGRPILCGASRDVTDEVSTRLELERRSAEANAAAGRLEALIAASMGPTFEVSADWKTMRHFSLPDDEVEAQRQPTSRWLQGYVHADDIPLVNQAIEGALLTKQAFDVEHRVNLPGGGVGWAHSRVIPLLSAKGDVESWFGVAYSITERKEAEAALRRSEVRYRSLIEATSAVTWSCPPTGEHDTPQPLWMAFTGQSADEMLGAGWAEVVHPDDRAVVRHEWERCVETGEPLAVVQRLRRRDGDWRWMSVAAVPVPDQDGVIQEWFGMHIDITERKNLEFELQSALRAASAANAAKLTFIANMSHEIRTPMSTVIGMLDVLLLTPLSEQQRQHTAIARKSALDLLHVLGDVLDASAIEAGRVSIHNRPFKLRALLEEMVAIFGLRAKQRDLTLKSTVASDVPEWQLADERRIRQVLNNLIGNALKYTEKGDVEVSASFNEDRRALRVEVTDTGIGIAEEAQQHLFQPFFQADSALSRRYEGSGLGLSISRKLVELMGGRIGVSSRLGEGSTFWWEIPAAACEAADEDASAVEAEAAVPPLHILVADDNAAARRILEAILTAMGHSATLVDNGAAAVAEVASGRYDVVLMDVMMPGMDGPSASRKIRELGGRAGDIPIVAMTADILFGRDGGHLLAGMTDYISKPVDLKLLAAVLRRACLHRNAIADAN